MEHHCSKSEDGEDYLEAAAVVAKEQAELVKLEQAELVKLEQAELVKLEQAVIINQTYTDVEQADSDYEAAIHDESDIAELQYYAQISRVEAIAS